VASVVNAFVGSEVLPNWIAGQGTLLVTLSGPRRAWWWEHASTPGPAAASGRARSAAGRGHHQRPRLTSARPLFRIGNGTGEIDGGIRWEEGSQADQLDLSIRATGSRWLRSRAGRSRR
jgi:hypothetical protein